MLVRLCFPALYFRNTGTEGVYIISRSACKASFQGMCARSSNIVHMQQRAHARTHVLRRVEQEGEQEVSRPQEGEGHGLRV
jgi:hypothetical protein